MTARVVDVSHLEEEVVDSRALVWWGNLSMMTIEGTMFAMIIATYLYLKTVNLDWPPTTVPIPDLVLPTIDLAILIMSLIPAMIADKAAKRGDVPTAQIGLGIVVLCGIAFLIIRAINLQWLGFKWSDHAYGSVIWISFGMHTFHCIAATGETALLVLYSLGHPMVKKRLIDARCSAVYWYFVVVTWLPFYFIVYIAPHLMRKERF